MGVLVAIGCFVGGGAAGAALGLALSEAVAFYAAPPSGRSSYAAIPRRVLAGGLVAIFAVVLAAALAGRVPVPWQVAVAFIGAKICFGVTFGVLWLWALITGVAFQDAP